MDFISSDNIPGEILPHLKVKLEIYRKKFDIPGEILLCVNFTAVMVRYSRRNIVLNKTETRNVSHLHDFVFKHIQSTLVISKSKGPSKTLRDIRTSTYQMCRIEENTNRTTKFHK